MKGASKQRYGIRQNEYTLASGDVILLIAIYV